MARNQSGGLKKLLNFIGLVDEDKSRDTYGEEDFSGGGYGRQGAYPPARQQRSTAPRQSRTADNRRLGSGAQERPSRYDDDSRYDSRDSRAARGASTRGYDDYRASDRRPASRFDSGSTRTERQNGRYSNQPDDRYAGSSQRALQTRAPRSSRSRTVMYSLHSLEDCCEVIDQLIANNTVVLTMDELDGSLLQRAVDTLSGAVFALHASIRKASDRTYLIAPNSVVVDEAYDLDRRY